MNYLSFFDLLGTVAFALSGGIVAVRKNMDIFGVLVFAVITAIGGGIIRDVLLGIFPPFCFTNEIYIILGIISGFVVFVMYSKIDKIMNIIVVLDAIGLGTFAIIGTAKAYSHVGIIGAVILGTISGVAGGMIRDTMSMEIPFVLRKEIYASACIVGSSLFCILIKLHISKDLSILICVLITITIRLLAIKYKLSLPRRKLR